MEEAKNNFNEVLYLEFVSIGNSLARHFPSLSEFKDEELGELEKLESSFDTLKNKKEFTQHPLVIKMINFVIKHKDKLANTVDKEEKTKEMTDLLQRTQANFENYQKQTDRRVEEMQQIIMKNTLLKLLPLVDTFELSLKHTSSAQEFKQGMELIYAQLLTLLEEEGAQSFKSAGEKFDPYYHEALLKVDSELPENTILEEFQKGFMIDGKVLRHAKVKISTGKKQNEPKNNHQEELK